MNKSFLRKFPYTVGVTSKTFSKLFLFLFLSFSSLTFAQPEFDDDTDDETVPASIDSGIVVLLFTGIALGFYLLKKGEKIKN